MYLPSHFNESRTEVIHDFIRANPFCSLVSFHEGELFASHLPLLLDVTAGEHGVLRGHLARANPHTKLDGARTLAMFQGPNAYVSPAFYPSKREHGRVVPTWNYSVVHVCGTLHLIDDAAFTAKTVEDLTTVMESGREHPWTVADAPADFLARTLRAIVGVELRIQTVEAKFKLSQNRNEADFRGVVDGLGESYRSTDLDVARIMSGLPR